MPWSLGFVVIIAVLCASVDAAQSVEPSVAVDAKPNAVAKPTVEEVGEEFFERKIRPLLAQHCYSCHGRGQQKGGLKLDSREGLLAGGESGTVVVLGKPEESSLIEAVAYDGLQMPPSGKLADDEIAALRQWVSLGAPWPVDKPGEGGGTIRTDGKLTDADRAFWSFQPIANPAPPTTQNKTWPRGSLDQFILSRLESEGMKPTAEADRRAMIRRATFDLLGLPPTAEEVEAFVTDRRPDAYERLLTRLLESPHFGERWARHWLDVARYGEDQAHTFAARMYPSGFRYRDWVVASLNADLPFDQFLLEQIAGDLLPDDGRRIDRLPALGFFALGPVYYADAGCSVRAKADEYDDRIDTLSRGILGLTVACARCHDHKFDPISARDYYALAGVFAGTDYVEAPLAPAEVVKKYNDAAAQVKQAEQKLKEAQQAEARVLSEENALQAAACLTAVRKFEQQRKADPKFNLATIAKATGLPQPLLDRWRQFVETDRTTKSAFLATWRALADSATDAEVKTVADDLQAKLTAAVELRRSIAVFDKREKKSGAKQAPKPTLDKASADLLKLLVDDRQAPCVVQPDRVAKLASVEAAERLASLQKEVDEQKKSLGEKYPIAHSLTDGKPTDLQVHVRGNPKDLGETVPRRFLGVLTPGEPKPFQQGSGRLELARRIASSDNPLTARVFVNRVWQQLFGRGIVGTPSNFGLLGERPTHPELLDHLATRFIASKWSVKQLLREVMLSATYRQASDFNAENAAHDPDNRLLWRMNRRRLDVEAWRDALLFVGGTLELKLGGPSINLNNGGNHRRTLYAAVSRHELNPMLRLFDFPDPNLTSERRVMTTVPMQQLFVLNSEFMISRARDLAALVQQQAQADDGARIEALYLRVLGRKPTAEERSWGIEFVTTPSEAGKSVAKMTPWEQYAQALLSTNEFTFID